jgi:hypothetical protein
MKDSAHRMPTLIRTLCERTEKWNVLKKLVSFPPGLDALYKRMMQQIGASDDAERCKQVLASISLTYQPITLAELATLTELLDGIADESDVEKVVGLCGSFPTLREGTVYFVHQSAQDFLLAKASDEVFPHGIEAAHHVIFSRSLAILSRTLHRDMYSLEAPGVSVDDIKSPTPDPLQSRAQSVSGSAVSFVLSARSTWQGSYRISASVSQGWQCNHTTRCMV